MQELNDWLQTQRRPGRVEAGSAARLSEREASGTLSASFGACQVTGGSAARLAEGAARASEVEAAAGQQPRSSASVLNFGTRDRSRVFTPRPVEQKSQCSTISDNSTMVVATVNPQAMVNPAATPSSAESAENLRVSDVKPASHSVTPPNRIASIFRSVLAFAGRSSEAP